MEIPSEQLKELMLIVEKLATIHRRKQWHVEYAELVSIGNLAMWEAVQKYDPSLNDSLKKYVATIVYYKMLDASRIHGYRHSRHSKKYLKRVDMNFDHLQSSFASAFDLAQTSEFLQMPCLNERQSRILKQHFVEGFSLKEISEQEGVVESRVSQIKRDAIRRIQDFAFA